MIAARRSAPFGENARDVVVALNLRAGRRGWQAAIEAGVAGAVIGDTAGRVELDRLERPHERPAQPESVLYGLVEILGRDDAVADQAARLGEQRALQSIEHEAVDLPPHHDRHLPEPEVDRLGTLECFLPR